MIFSVHWRQIPIFVVFEGHISYSVIGFWKWLKRMQDTEGFNFFFPINTGKCSFGSVPCGSKSVTLKSFPVGPSFSALNFSRH